MNLWGLKGGCNATLRSRPPLGPDFGNAKETPGTFTMNYHQTQRELGRGLCEVRQPHWVLGAMPKLQMVASAVCGLLNMSEIILMQKLKCMFCRQGNYHHGTVPHVARVNKVRIEWYD